MVLKPRALTDVPEITRLVFKKGESMKLTGIFLSLMFATLTLAADSSYQLKGQFNTKASRRPVEFTLQWSEEKGRVKGQYKDNFFADSVPVVGTAGEGGRSFTVGLPKEVSGVKTLHLLSSGISQERGSSTIPVGVIARDDRGTPLSSTSTDAQLVRLQASAQAQEEAAECTEGFGILAGYCGSYFGLISEEEDRYQSCDLLEGGAIQLQVTNEGSLYLHLGEGPSEVLGSEHYLGRLSASPESPIIDVMVRDCGPLAHVSFKNVSSECKVLNLRGTFSEEGDQKLFNGNYSVRHEVTGRSCSYGLSLNR